MPPRKRKTGQKQRQLAFGGAEPDATAAAEAKVTSSPSLLKRRPRPRESKEPEAPTEPVQGEAAVSPSAAPASPDEDQQEGKQHAKRQRKPPQAEAEQEAAAGPASLDEEQEEGKQQSARQRKPPQAEQIEREAAAASTPAHGEESAAQRGAAGSIEQSGPKRARTAEQLLRKEKRKLQKSYTSKLADGRKVRRGDRAAKEIGVYQSSTALLIPKVAFQRVIRELAVDIGRALQHERWASLPKELRSAGAPPEEEVPYRFEMQALCCLQEASEEFVVGLLEDANICAAHAKRVTIMSRDLALSMRMRRPQSRPSKWP
mmetsp:Transcript_68815/g.165184  ORF Transcript_68815/g.165184 Transcript_68815/m.165184 type:complete len:317 (-) Transcript_68815:18-968(-)